MKIWRMALTGLAFAIGFAVYGGSQGRISQAAETEEANTSNILIAYDAPGADTPAAETAALLKEETNGRLLRIGEADEENISSFEYVFLGFEAEKNALPEEVEAFLEENDFGARTIFPFVAGEDNDAEEILQAISQLQPGALLGDALMLSSEVTEQEIGEWVQELGVLREEILPEAGGDTVASAVVRGSRYCTSGKRETRRRLRSTRKITEAISMIRIFVRILPATRFRREPKSRARYLSVRAARFSSAATSRRAWMWRKL